MKSRCNCPLHLSNNPSYDYCRSGRLDIYIWYKAMSEGAGTNTSGSLFNFIREIWRLIKDCKRPKYIRKFRIFGGKFIFVIDAAFCNPSIFRKGHQSSSVYLELRQQNRPASNSPPPPLPFTAGGSTLLWCAMFSDDLFAVFVQSLMTTGNSSLCHQFRRFGNSGDGGYDVCMSSSFAPKPGNCLVYSFG